MKYRNVGKSGLLVSTIGLGCNNFGVRVGFEGAQAVIHKALDVGITLFDTADMYGGQGGSETIIGSVLGERRKDIVLATKFGMPMDKDGALKGASRRYIMTAVEASLKRLKTDWIDLYQLHQPDPLTPIEETLRALDDLVRQGKVRYVGCSNLPAWAVVDAQWTAEARGLGAFISCQDEYSLIMRDLETDVMPAAAAFGLGVLPFYPLAAGLLTGKYRRDAPLPEGARLTKAKGQPNADRFLTPERMEIAGKLTDFAIERGHSAVELAFSWLLAQPIVPSVIAGATKPAQVEENAKAADWLMSADDLAQIDRLAPPRSAAS